jgi:predicted secreted protein
MSIQNYNSEGMVLGNEFFVFNCDASANATPLGYATTCTLSLSANTIDKSNKMSGVWSEALPGQLSWTITTSALYASEATWGYAAMAAAMKARTPYLIRFGRVTNYDHIADYTVEANYQLDSSAGYEEGYAWITSVELNAGNNEVASYSVTFTGNGKLDHKTA